MADSAFVALQYVLPKKALTQLAGFAAGQKAGALLQFVLRWFVRRYGVNMGEAANPDLKAYTTFNEFFTRPLKSGVRPLATAPFVCPVDGAISQFGFIKRDQVFQAKGHSYSTTALVGGDANLAKFFDDGLFATLYLSPRDYHRIHMPCDGTLTRMIYVPGELFSVNPDTAQGVPGLFARNERLVCVFDSTSGPFVLVLVGATIVGSMATVWHGVVNPPRTELRDFAYKPGEVVLQRGDEMGRFLLGSTVVMLFPRGAFDFNAEWQPGGGIRMGELMGTVRPA